MVQNSVTPFRLMTTSPPGIGVPFVVYGNKPPLVAFRLQSEFQDTESLIVVSLNVAQRILNLMQILTTAGAHHELTDATFGIDGPPRVLRCKTLVIVIMSGENDV